MTESPARLAGLGAGHLVLVVDDEQSVRQTFRRILESRGHRVDVAPSAEVALSLLERRPIDLALVDIVLPGMSGIDLATIIRSHYPAMATVLVTGYATSESTLARLVPVCDDFLTKPCTDEMLLGTVENVMEARHEMYNATKDQLADRGKRGGRGPNVLDLGSGPKLHIGDVELHLITHSVRVRGARWIELSKIEHSLLYWLLKRSPRVVDYVELGRLVRGDEGNRIRLSRHQATEFLKDHVKRLRKKIEQRPGRPGYIGNKRGTGYYLIARSDGG